MPGSESFSALSGNVLLDAVDEGLSLLLVVVSVGFLADERLAEGLGRGPPGVHGGDRRLDNRGLGQGLLLGGDGRVLVRASGTEPLIRVMVEAKTQEQAAECANRLAAFVQTVKKLELVFINF